jgi:hypothetical protein
MTGTRELIRQWCAECEQATPTRICVYCLEQLCGVCQPEQLEIVAGQRVLACCPACGPADDYGCAL